MLVHQYLTKYNPSSSINYVLIFNATALLWEIMRAGVFFAWLGGGKPCSWFYEQQPRRLPESVCVPYIKLIKCRDTNVDMGENEDWKISLQASGSASAMSKSRFHIIISCARSRGWLRELYNKALWNEREW